MGEHDGKATAQHYQPHCKAPLAKSKRKSAAFASFADGPQKTRAAVIFFF